MEVVEDTHFSMNNLRLSLAVFNAALDRCFTCVQESNEKLYICLPASYGDVYLPLPIPGEYFHTKLKSKRSCREVYHYAYLYDVYPAAWSVTIFPSSPSPIIHGHSAMRPRITVRTCGLSSSTRVGAARTPETGPAGPSPGRTGRE